MIPLDRELSTSMTFLAERSLPSVNEVADELLLHFAKKCLFNLFNLTIEAPLFDFDAIENSPPLLRVNVTLRRGGRLLGSMSGGGETLADQIRIAVSNASLDKRFRARITAAEIGMIDIELWLQVGYTTVTPEDLGDGRLLRWGIDGIEVSADGKSAYYKPSVPLTSGKHSNSALLTAICRKAGLDKSRWRAEGLEVKRTHWRLVTENLAIKEGWRGSGTNRLSGRHLIEALQASASYLINGRQASGEFTYLYDPLAGNEILEPHNRVRSEGCFYALSKYQSSVYYTPTIAFQVGFEHIAASHVQRLQKLDDGTLVVPDQDSKSMPKLGATALLALALGRRPLISHYEAPYHALLASIKNAQGQDGRFLTHFGSDTENVRSSEFFAGQALLCLVEKAEAGDLDAIERCGRAFATYRNQFLAAPSSAFAGWQVEVWARLAKLTCRNDFADFVFEQCDWLLNLQILESWQPTWVGGFSSSGVNPKFSSIVFTEALVHGYVLAKRIGDLKREELYRNRLFLAVSFCWRLRLEDHPSSWYLDPERSAGAVGLSPLDLRVRSDVPQHFITMCLAFLGSGLADDSTPFRRE